jgi:hypothetical protein
MVIDALGTSPEVLEALPYTQIHFDQPVIANALERAQIGKFHSENVFNLVSSRFPLDIAVEMADKNVSSDMKTSADILSKLRNIQNKGDKQDEKRIDLELEQKKKDIEQTEAQTKATEESVSMQKAEVKSVKKHSSSESSSTKGKSPAEENREKALSDKQEKGYSRLEQKQHEKTRVGATKRSEKIAKAQGQRI